MRMQSNRRMAQLIKQFPAVGVIRAESRFRDFSIKDRKEYKLPDTYIHVQRADPETMHLKGDDVGWRGHYICHDKLNLRGTQLERLVAVDQNEKAIAALDWAFESRHLTKISAQDIFQKAKPEDIKYLIWITVIRWYEPSETGSGSSIEEPLVGKELQVYIFLPHKDLSWNQLIELANKIKNERENAWKYPPKIMQEMVGIETALRNGCKIHAFSSGGGLRVIGITKNGKDVGYGEHPNIEEALLHANEDYLAGGLPYHSVYGKKYPHYLTGSTECTSNLDLWLRRGCSFDVYCEGGEVVFILNGWHQTKWPKELGDKVLETGNPEKFEERGFVYLLTHINFPGNSKAGVSCKVLKKPEGEGRLDPWMYRITKTGRGKNFWQAMLSAFEAEEIEVKRE